MNANLPEWLNSTYTESCSDYEAQCQSVRKGSVISLLSSFSLIHVSGEDAQTFLQGQLSSDIRELTGANGQFSSYSTAKGRVLASCLLWKFGSDYYILLSADIAQAICKRLSMFIMRSRVTIMLSPGHVLIGLNGPHADAWLGAQLESLPVAPLSLVSAAEGALCLRLPGGALLLALESGQAAKWQSPDPGSLAVIGPEAWSLLDIGAGIPWVEQNTQEQFVAQMINMDVIGGVSFSKGCYSGQEIIARTRYLGKIKRRMYRVQFSREAKSGDALYCPATGEQAIGMLVNIARDENAQYTALAVVQSVCWDDGVFLDKDNSVALGKLSLPYDLPDE